ncbi:MAG TPA: UDP-N-acetylmuramoyl-L-alanine--D-glutamate ligase [Candidatus Rubrimentiphilum sp.]|nr:UDP-N-acetylmuramoyl-L-alanine--D-glutamate ligase [Candidatus Rubrimentiphilum sp.]
MNFAGGEKILVIGLGRSGQAVVEVLRARGAEIFATDEKPRAEIAGAVAQIETLGAKFVPPENLAGLTDLACAVLSPGVPLNGELVRRIQSADVPVFSEIEVAYRLCKAPIIAITGTKGKSTTAALTGHLLRAAGKDVRVGGNIGNPLIREVVGAPAESWVVAEVSSFQLETIRSFRPRVSTILNISPDHLDRYHSMDEYIEAKYRIFANQNEHDAFIGNLDDERLAALHWHTGEARIRAKQLWFTLGDDSRRATMYLRGESLMYSPVTGDPRPLEIARRDDIALAGVHNVQNVMAASLAALAAGLEPRSLREAIRSFNPMDHRLQPVGDVDGVLYVDDSKATNPGAVIAALRSYDKPIVLIAGGKPKNTDFTELGRIIDERARALIVIGEAADDIAAHVYRIPTERANSMEDAVRRAQALAKPGDVVLLSPACASFDMFESAEDRGRKFTDAVLGSPAR